MTRPAPRRRAVLCACLVLVVGSAGCSSDTLSDSSVGAADVAEAAVWFRGEGPITTPIDDSWVLHPDSDAVAALLSEEGTNQIVNTESFAVPVVESDPDEPLLPLAITRSEVDDWGTNDLSTIDGLRVPEGTRAAPGSDGKLVVIDRENDRVLDMFQAVRTDTGWEATWGGVYPLSGNGASRYPVYEGQGPNGREFPLPISRATGSGLSSLAGLLTVADMAAGEIDHALVFATDRACGPENLGPFFSPATTTDGWVTDQTCMPEGARVQLDPSIDLTSLDLTRAEFAVARALQVYGAFCIDNGGSRMGFIAELPPDDAGVQVYRDAGLEGDYSLLEGVPWDQLRVLVPADELDSGGVVEPLAP